MKSSLNRFILFSFILSIISFSFTPEAISRLEWNLLKSVSLGDTPKDIVISSDGDVAYILGSKTILRYSFQENQITDTIPLASDFSQIALSPDGEQLLLTDSKKKQVSIIQLYQFFDMKAGESPVIGKIDAPVAIFAFLDYQCPYCSKVYPILEQLLKQYPDEVKLVIKHYPLQMNVASEKAAIAILAAKRQKKHEEMSRILLLNFKKLNDITIKKFAEQNGLDMDQFIKDCSDPSIKNLIQDDIQLGKSVNVHGVPTLFMNGRLIRNRSIPELSDIVGRALGKKDVEMGSGDGVTH